MPKKEYHVGNTYFSPALKAEIEITARDKWDIWFEIAGIPGKKGCGAFAVYGKKYGFTRIHTI